MGLDLFGIPEVELPGIQAAPPAGEIRAADRLPPQALQDLLTQSFVQDTLAKSLIGPANVGFSEQDQQVGSMFTQARVNRQEPRNIEFTPFGLSKRQHLGPSQTLAHEVGHVIDLTNQIEGIEGEVKEQHNPRRIPPFKTAGISAEGQHDPDEHFANAFANAFLALRTTSSFESAQEARDFLETEDLRVPGTKTLVDDFLLNLPVFNNHPLASGGE